MDYLLQTLVFMFSFCVCISCIVHYYILKPNSGHRKLPPGPNPFPIIGNILELGQKPHQSLAKLSKIYGPLMHLKLGSITTVVVSSPEIAKIVLQKQDKMFCNRTTPEAIRASNHHKFSVAWLPRVDHQWRNIRKVWKEQMFSVSKLDASQGLRMEKLQKLWEYVNDCCESGEVVDIGRAAYTTSLNLISATAFSKDFAAFGSDDSSSQEIRETVWGIMESVGKPNLADYFPILKLVDPQGVFRKSRIMFKKLVKIFDEIIRERLQSRQVSGYTPKNDVLDALLDLNQKNEAEVSFDDIKHLLLDLFIAGTDTSSSTVEWAMTELIRNPEKMLKVRKELENTVGHNGRVQESDISKLPYLQAVIKETFRLHPVAPLLLPHKAGEDVEIKSYTVPKNAQILVNIWAIGRDFNLWSEPDSFMPERFLEQEIDIRGQHFELIPFGAGRRICAGLPLGYSMVHLMVATLVHNFNWRLEEGLKHREIDLDENFGVTLKKTIPLKAIPFKL